MARYRIQSLSRAFVILEMIGYGPRPLTLTEIARRAGLHSATAFRFLSVLSDLGYVRRNEPGDTYALGYRLYRLATGVGELDLVRRAARPVLTRLAFVCGETAHLGVIEGAKVVYLDKIDTGRSVRIGTEVGLRLDAHTSGLGKVLLAHMPAGEVGQMYAHEGLRPHTARSITSIAALQRDLAQIRRKGVGFDDEESIAGVRCVAAPVLDSRGRAICAISVSGAAARVNRDTLPAMATKVREAALEIAAALERSY